MALYSSITSSKLFPRSTSDFIPGLSKPPLEQNVQICSNTEVMPPACPTRTECLIKTLKISPEQPCSGATSEGMTRNGGEKRTILLLGHSRKQTGAIEKLERRTYTLHPISTKEKRSQNSIKRTTSLPGQSPKLARESSKSISWSHASRTQELSASAYGEGAFSIKSTPLAKTNAEGKATTMLSEVTNVTPETWDDCEVKPGPLPSAGVVMSTITNPLQSCSDEKFPPNGPEHFSSDGGEIDRSLPAHKMPALVDLISKTENVIRIELTAPRTRARNVYSVPKEKPPMSIRLRKFLSRRKLCVASAFAYFLLPSEERKSVLFWNRD